MLGNMEKDLVERTWKELRYNSQHSQLIYHTHFIQKMIPNGENLKGTLPTLLTSYPHPS